MHGEIIDLWKDGMNTVLLMKIPKEMEVPDIPKIQHEAAWREYWKHEEKAKLLHLGMVEVNQD